MNKINKIETDFIGTENTLTVVRWEEIGGLGEKGEGIKQEKKNTVIDRQ